MGLRMISHTRATRYKPEYADYAVFSDLSGQRLSDEDVWSVHGIICGPEDMLDFFEAECLEPVESEAEYEQGKKFIMEKYHYGEDYFDDHPTIYQVYGKTPASEKYKCHIFIIRDMMYTDDLYDFLPAGYDQPNIDSLPVDESTPYNPDEEY